MEKDINSLLTKYNIDINTVRCTFLGQPAAQSFASFFLWEKLLTRYQFKRFIELGTGQGNLSLYLYLFCLNKSVEFYSYDHVDTDDCPVKDKVNFRSCFHLENIFDIEDQIAVLIQKPETTILFCDNGNKKEEFRTFSKYLKKGDIIGVHDWDTEIFLKDIEDIIKKDSLMFILEDDCKKYDSSIRFITK